MTFFSATLSAANEIGRRRSPARWVILASLTAGVAITFQRTREVWETGAFFDTDDAMRMVQVRDLVAGQNWYDMSVARLNPAHGMFSHWSRAVDAPLVLLLKFFEMFADAPTAEALTRITFPLLLLAGLYSAVAWIARQFGDAFDEVLAICLAFASGAIFTQFIPGRIDHHAPQILLLALMTSATLAAFDPARARLAALSGAIAAVSLSISIENLPFIVVLAAAQPIAWIWRGEEQRAALLTYAVGLAVSLVACFFVTIGQQRWSVVACDAYSFGYAAAGLTGAASLAALAALSPHVRSAPTRLVTACFFGAAPAVAMYVTAPLCFGDPFVGLDPLVRSIWLENVSEMQKLADIWRSEPSTAETLGMPIAVSAAACLIGALWTRGQQRARFILLAALIAVGLAMMFWGVRVFSSVAPLAACGGAVCVSIALRSLRFAPTTRALCAFLLALPFAPAFYAVALPANAPAIVSSTGGPSCLSPEAMKSFGALPPGLVLAPIDLGAHLLAFTNHTILAAPYHRNNSGNRIVIDAFLARPAEAERIARQTGATYLVICPTESQFVRISRRAPDGLASALISGTTPEWLQPIDGISAPIVAYRIKPTTLEQERH